MIRSHDVPRIGNMHLEIAFIAGHGSGKERAGAVYLVGDT